MTQASALGLRACETDSKTLLFSRLLFKLKCSKACLPGAGPLGWGAQCGAQKHSLLLRKPLTIIILQFVGSPPEVMGLDYIVSPPLLRISFWFFFLP